MAGSPIGDEGVAGTEIIFKVFVRVDDFELVHDQLILILTGICV